jgi:hypothetical protein
MEIQNLLIVYPIIFIALGIIISLFNIKWKIKGFYLVNVLIAVIVAYFILRFEFSNSSGSYIYIPFYSLLCIIGSLFVSASAGVVRKLSSK